LDLKLWREGLKDSLVPVMELPARPLTLRPAGCTQAKVAREAIWLIIFHLILFLLCDQNMTCFGF